MNSSLFVLGMEKLAGIMHAGRGAEPVKQVLRKRGPLAFSGKGGLEKIARPGRLKVSSNSEFAFASSHDVTTL